MLVPLRRARELEAVGYLHVAMRLSLESILVPSGRLREIIREGRLANEVRKIVSTISSRCLALITFRRFGCGE